MKIREMDVDDVLFEFLERIQHLDAPRTGRMIDETGVNYAPYCECGGRERVFAEVNLPDHGDFVFERWICAACNVPWIFSQGEIKVHEVQLPVHCGSEHERGEIELLGRALKLLTVWESRLYLQLYLWDNCHSRTEIARIANKRHASRATEWREWRRGPHSQWTEWYVRQHLSSAQKKIFRELGLRSRAETNPTMKLEDHFRHRQPERL